MSRINVPASMQHKAIAEYLEDKFSPELFSFMDGGTTLDLSAEALNQCRQDPHWQALARHYESSGGSISCPDDNEWEVA